jgi:DNA ligase (NAD+)
MPSGFNILLLMFTMWPALFKISVSFRSPFHVVRVLRVRNISSRRVDDVDLPRNKEKAAARMQVLNDQINRHDFLYYTESRPDISDSDYDKLVIEAQAIAKEFPELRTAVRKLDAVGANPDQSFTLFKHSRPMLSLQNAYSFEELQSFISKVHVKCSTAKGPNYFPEFIVEPKIDGVSLSLIYEHGRLNRAVTRGDGQSGEDVTHNILKHVTDIPDKLDSELSAGFSACVIQS